MLQRQSVLLILILYDTFQCQIFLNATLSIEEKKNDFFFVIRTHKYSDAYNLSRGGQEC